MSTSKPKALATVVKNRKLEMEDNKSTPQPEKTMEDVPPEVLTMILERVSPDKKKNNLMALRFVNSQWKDVVDCIIEKRIVSGDIPAFPRRIKLTGVERQNAQLHVPISCSTRFSAGGNPFPFNTLHLGNNRDLNKNVAKPNLDGHYRIPMSLTAFASKFCGNLTSLSLHNQEMFIDTLATILGSMSGLKRLSLVNVGELYMNCIQSAPALPTAPPLPSLKLLEVKSTHSSGTGIILYVWLITSYADQLARMNLETYHPLPCLQQQRRYFIPDHDEVSIATTSATAFGRLKELNILRPSRLFCQFSKLPAIQRPSVTWFDRLPPLDARTIAGFIGRCGDTLEYLSLNFMWDELMIRDVPRLPPGTVNGNLKRLAIPYPRSDDHEMFVSMEFLVMFPALEELQFLYFSSSEGIVHFNDQLVDEFNQVDREGDTIAALKERLVSIRQDGDEKRRIIRQQINALDLEPRNGFQFNYKMHSELSKQLRDLETTTRNDSLAVFKRLAALGEKRKKVIVELLLERVGIWNTCPNLKIVVASSEGMCREEVCVIRRTDDA